MLIGCSSATTVTSSQMCNSIEPIRPSRKDVLTAGTKEQIVGTNAAIETWCGSAGSAPQKVAAR
jgi:hypothetical protein